MIFIGYSSGDRYTVVESLVFHLKNYGFEVWYDFYDMFLGDNRYEENFKKGISGSHYVIFNYYMKGGKLFCFPFYIACLLMNYRKNTIG